MSETGENSADDRQSTAIERLVAEVLEREDNTDGPDTSSAVTNIVARVLQYEQYKGAFPHPDSLREFDKVVANGAERAFTLTESEQRHRHTCDTKWMDAGIESQRAYASDRRLVIILAFILLLIGIIGSIVLLAIGKAVGAGILGGASLLVGLIGSLFFKVRNEKGES